MNSNPTSLQPRRSRGPQPLLLAVVFLAVVSAMAVAYLGSREARVQRTVYTKILQDKLEASRIEFLGFVRPVVETLDLLREWDRRGLLPHDDPATVRAMLEPLVERQPQIAAVWLERADGPCHLLYRAEEGWEPEGESEEHFLQARPWYAEFAAQADTAAPGWIYWSSFHSLPGLNSSGLTVAQAWSRSERPKERVVVACDVLQEELDALANQVPLTENGILILKRADDSFAWLSRGSERGFTLASGGDLLRGDDPAQRVVAAAIGAWHQDERPLVHPFLFRLAQQRWWGVFFPLEDDSPRPLIGLFAPAGDLSARLQKVTNTFTYLLFGLLILGVTVVVWLARTYRERLTRLIYRLRPRLESEEDVRRLIQDGESERLEFKSTLRWNLKANKPGKEIELAWLKTVVAYLNSEGGVLLIGVDDDGTVLGIEPDGFRNEDKYLLHFNNVVKQHIGLEFARFLRVHLIPWGDKRVLVVQCEQAGEPVFLKNEEDEEFYIRVGPSSRKLGTSKILEYLQSR